MTKKNKFYFKIFIWCFLILLGAFILYKLLKTVFLSTFSLKSIVTSEEDIRLDLKGRSIFEIDLRRIFESLTLNYPQYKIVRVIIRLPNQLVIKTEKRIPIAYVRLSRDLAVDREGALFQVQDFIPDLPVIYGLETKLKGYSKAWQRPKIRELQLALELIQKFNQVEQFKGYKLRRINLESFGLTFYMDGIEVKIDDKISEGLVLLERIFSQLTQESAKVNYIDLRFKEPIVKYEK